jgi:hypothetical protein
MLIDKRLSLLTAQHEDSIANIKRMLSATEEYEQPFIRLITYILESEDNPYSFLPDGWGGSLNTSSGTECLLNHIHHAMVDDGDICFVKYNNDVRISFTDRYEQPSEANLHLFLGLSAVDVLKRFGKLEQAVQGFKFLSSSDEFIEEHKCSSYAFFKRCYITDAARHGVPFANNHYVNHRFWSQDLHEQFKQDISTLIAKYQAIGMVLRD